MILSWFFENFFIANKGLWVLCGVMLILTYIGAAVLLCALPVQERKSLIKGLFGKRENRGIRGKEKSK